MARPYSPVFPLSGGFSPRSHPYASSVRRWFSWSWPILLPSLLLPLALALFLVWDGLDSPSAAPGRDEAAAPDTTVRVLKGSVEGLAGRPLVVDGDTLRLGRAHVRLDGIDAPDRNQICRSTDGPWRCGAAATAQLWLLTGGETVTCERTGTDAWGRMVGLCRVGGADLGAEMVRAGLAQANQRYSPRYLLEEREARAARRGIWDTDIQTPGEWPQG